MRYLKIEVVDHPTVLKATVKPKKAQTVVKKEKIIDEKPSISSWKIECRHDWFPWGDANTYIQYACDISWWDVDFILMLQKENGSRDYKRQSNWMKNWVREKSFWFCQVMYTYHKGVYDNLPYNRIQESRFLTDWKYQMDVCWTKYKNWTRFYGYDTRYQWLKWLIFIGWKYY